MKLEKKIKILILVLIILVIIPGAIFLFNSGDKANVVSNEKNNEKNDKYDESDVLAHFDKMYVKKMDDEWFYNFSIIYIPESKETRHFFNGCNLKYDHLDDYYVAVKDENGNVVDKWDFFPVLNISRKSVNGVTESEEIGKIDKYFDNKNFNKKITNKDIYDLRLDNFSKELIVELYNKTLAKKSSNIMGPYKMNPCTIQTDKMNKDYKWNIGVMTGLGTLEAIRLDIKYSDGTYLSDKIKNKTASDEQIKLYGSFEEIEEYMVKEQKINLKEKFPQYTGEYYDRLYTIVDTFDDGWD